MLNRTLLFGSFVFCIGANASQGPLLIDGERLTCSFEGHYTGRVGLNSNPIMVAENQSWIEIAAGFRGTHVTITENDLRSGGVSVESPVYEETNKKLWERAITTGLPSIAEVRESDTFHVFFGPRTIVRSQEVAGANLVLSVNPERATSVQFARFELRRESLPLLAELRLPRDLMSDSSIPHLRSVVVRCYIDRRYVH